MGYLSGVILSCYKLKDGFLTLTKASIIGIKVGPTSMERATNRGCGLMSKTCRPEWAPYSVATKDVGSLGAMLWSSPTSRSRGKFLWYLSGVFLPPYKPVLRVGSSDLLKSPSLAKCKRNGTLTTKLKVKIKKLFKCLIIIITITLTKSPPSSLKLSLT